MLPALKYRLEKHQWYLQIRYHPFVLFLWLQLRRDVAKALNAQRKFYDSILKDLDIRLVIDIGANEGFLTSIFNSLGFNVVAIEPSQRNFSILKARNAGNTKIRVLNIAISDKAGNECFFESKTNYAIGTLNEKWKEVGTKQYGDGEAYTEIPVFVQTITLDEIIKGFGVPGFIKIDVEGHEEKVLKGLSQPVPLISFEAILPYFLEETINSIEYLHSICTKYVFNYTTAGSFVHKDFILKEVLVREIKSLPPQTVEIFCKNDLVFNPS